VPALRRGALVRARSIKPGFWDNELLAECEPFARLLFIGLWNIADREGRLEERIPRIRKTILGYDDVDAAALLDQLAERGFIQRYEVNGARYIQVVKFGKHQHPHVAEPASTLPAPESTIPAPCESGASTIQAPCENAGLPIPLTHSLTPDSSISANADGERPVATDAPPVPTQKAKREPVGGQRRCAEVAEHITAAGMTYRLSARDAQAINGWRAYDPQLLVAALKAAEAGDWDPEFFRTHFAIHFVIDRINAYTRWLVNPAIVQNGKNGHGRASPAKQLSTRFGEDNDYSEFAKYGKAADE
jgi:hypothetical protein